MQCEKTITFNRIDWLDIAKGYGILLVIFAHLDTGSIQPIKTWIYTFHMPLFFFLSGYVFSTKYDFKTFVKRKCKSILLPYFALGIPMIVFCVFWDCYWGDEKITVSISLIERFILQKRFWTLWYIACLLFLNIGFYILVRKCKTMGNIAVATLILFSFGLTYYKLVWEPLPWNIDVCFTAVLFFAAGYWFKNNYSQMRSFVDRKRSIILFVMLGITNVVCGYLGIYISGCGLEMFDSSYGFPPMTIMSAFAGLSCVIIFSHWFSVAPIRYIGRNSLIYYAWHQTIMIPIARLFLTKIGIPCSEFKDIYIALAVSLLELIIIVIALTICNEIICKTKLRFMVGK